jgi:hypothetical protein
MTTISWLTLFIVWIVLNPLVHSGQNAELLNVNVGGKCSYHCFKGLTCIEWRAEAVENSSSDGLQAVCRLAIDGEVDTWGLHASEKVACLNQQVWTRLPIWLHRRLRFCSNWEARLCWIQVGYYYVIVTLLRCHCTCHTRRYVIWRVFPSFPLKQFSATPS